MECGEEVEDMDLEGAGQDCNCIENGEEEEGEGGGEGQAMGRGIGGRRCSKITSWLPVQGRNDRG